MDWYLREEDQRTVCYPCAMERMRGGETMLALYPQDRWVQCADCRTVFELDRKVYIPRFDMEVVPAQ